MKFLFSLFALSLSAHAAEVEKIDIALNWKAEPEFGGFYQASYTGLDRKQGIELKMIPGGAGQPIVQMVAAKKADFGVSSADEVIIARDRGADIVAIFAVYQTSPLAIMVHESLGVKSAEELFKKGATFSLQKGLPFFPFLKEKYDLSKMNFVPYNGGIAPFLLDQNFVQQCFIHAEPITAVREKAKVKSFLVADLGYNPYNTVIVTRGEIIRKRPELIKKLFSVFQEGWKDYLKSPTATNIKMNGLNPSMDLETFKEASRIQEPLVQTKETLKNGIGTMTEARWVELERQLLGLKLISRLNSDPASKPYWSPF